MKILQVIPVFYPALTFGGPVRVVCSTSKELAKRGHEVIVYTTNALDQKRNFKIRCRERVLNGFKVRYFENVFRFDGVYVSPSMVSALRKDMEDFDVVHLTSWRQLQDIFLHIFAKKNNVPYILQAHGSLPRIMAKQRLKLIYDAFYGYRLLRDASKVIALSHTEAKQYMDMGVPEKKIEIIPNGIDLSEYGDLPPKGSFKKKFSIDDDEKIVLYLGRIHESKGLNLLANAFAVVSSNLSSIRLVVVGPDDGYAATFSRLISDLGIQEKVLLTGFVQKRSKLAALVDSDVFVTPRFYGFPVTFLEACSAECPIVTASNELDWIHDNVGYVVENSPIVLAKAISKVLRHEATSERFRNNCKSAIKNFDISTVVSQLEDTYKSVVN